MKLFRMPGKSYQPLGLYGTDCEADRFRQAARKGNPLAELIGLTLLDTGVRTGEMAHMNSDWIIDGNNEIFGIEIPQGDDCRIGAGTAESRPNTHKKGKVCHMCRKQPSKSWAPPDADWRPKTKAAHRYIPIEEADTRQVLRAYFNLNDAVASHQTIQKYVKRIGDRADIPRKIRPYDLRHTYGTLLADKDFHVHKIKNLMGHASIKPATHYVKLSPRSMKSSFEEKW